MLKSTAQQGNANQNHDELSPHICQNAHHQKDKLNKCWQECEPGSPCCGSAVTDIVGGNVNCGTATAKSIMEKSKAQQPSDPAPTHVRIHPK